MASGVSAAKMPGREEYVSGARSHSPTHWMGKNLHANTPAASLLLLSRGNTGEQVSVFSSFMTAPKRAVNYDYRGTSNDTQQQLLGICGGNM